MTDPDQFPDNSEAPHATTEDVAPSVGGLAVSEEATLKVPSQPHHFRDHTNPYTMTMPDSWGSTRRT